MTGIDSSPLPTLPMGPRPEDRGDVQTSSGGTSKHSSCNWACTFLDADDTQELYSIFHECLKVPISKVTEELQMTRTRTYTKQVWLETAASAKIKVSDNGASCVVRRLERAALSLNVEVSDIVRNTPMRSVHLQYPCWPPNTQAK